MRIIGIIILAVLALYGSVIGAVAYFQRHLIYPGAYIASLREPVAQPPGVESVAIETSDGETLHGLWRAPRSGGGVVISFHGNASRPERHAERFTREPWLGGGWGVLTIAYRGYPGSTGAPSEKGLIQDGIAAYLYAAEHAPGAPILLHGHSLGAAVAVAVAERAPSIGLYLEAAFDSMSHVVRLHYPYLPSAAMLRDTYRSDLRIAHGAEPVFIVQGEQDELVVPKLARGLALAAGSRATIEVIPGDHVTILGTRDQVAEPLFRARGATTCDGAPPAR